VTSEETGQFDRAAALHRLTGRPDAELRPDQAEAIDALVRDRARVLVVQRTGWGKSAVYFLACQELRAAGSGPTLLVSPLLALMRDQLRAAEDAGLVAARIDSTNVDDWDDILGQLDDGVLDLLAVGPERLANPDFVSRVLGPKAQRFGLLVVDEAHAASAWGHDFRPDYRRVAGLLGDLAPGTPVLACTATATERVVDDLATLLDMAPDRVIRGELDRRSLHLRVVDRRVTVDRLAWLAAWALDRHAEGTKTIIFVQTVADTDLVAGLLADAGHPAVAAYSGRQDPDERVRLEAGLRNGVMTCLVATSALGMGYDLPDLGAVAHLGLPGTLLDYYQAIGRAGRALERAEVVALPTPQQRRIWEHFDSVSLPSPEQITAVVDALSPDQPTSAMAMEAVAPVSRTRLETLLKVLAVDGVVERVRGGYLATGRPWEPDPAVRAALQRARRDEHDQVERWLAADGCRTDALLEALDDLGARGPCGRCDGCGSDFPAVEVTDEVRSAVKRRLVAAEVVMAPRRQWPASLAEVAGPAGIVDGKPLKGRLGPAAPSDLRALGREGDGVVDDLVQAAMDALAAGATPAAALVEHAVGVLRDWKWAARPVAVTALVSADGDGELATWLADQIATLGRMDRMADVGCAASLSDLDARGNGVQIASAALQAIPAAPTPPVKGPVLLVTGAAGTTWAVTVAAARLHHAGAGPVLCLATTTRA